MVRLSDLDSEPILIGGCGRSGTTLLLSMLSAHPAIVALPHETEAFCVGAWEGRQPLGIDESIIAAALSTQLPTTTAHRYLEKTPKNICNIGQILRYFSGRVRIIHVVRDGRDVVLSQHPRTDPRAVWLPTPLKRKTKHALLRLDHLLGVRRRLVGLIGAKEQLVRQFNNIGDVLRDNETPIFHVPPQRWVQDVSLGREAEKHEQVLTVRYEDLVTTPEAILRKIMQHIREPFADELLDWHAHATVRKDIALRGEIQTTHGSSIGKWRTTRYKERVTSLLSLPETAGLLEHYGYEI